MLVCLFEFVFMHQLYLKLNYHRGNIYQNRESTHDYTTKHPCVYVNRYIHHCLFDKCKQVNVDSYEIDDIHSKQD